MRRLEAKHWIAAAAGLYLLVALLLPQLADEAYYADWARQPALGYLDHPPGIAWWIAGPGAGLPRLAGVLGVLLGAWLLGRASGAPSQVMALTLWTPLGLGAAVIVTPDTPLFVAWCGLLWAVLGGRVVLAGLLFGISLWCKSTALVALPGLIWVLRRRAPLFLLIAAAVYAPHVLWSIDHQGLPWTFQGARSVGGFHLHGALGGQLLVVSPGLFALAIWAWSRPDLDLRGRELRGLGLPILAFWMAASLITHVEANWPALAWPATALLVVRERPAWLGRGFALAVGWTVACGIGALLALRLLPIGAGPPRSPDRLRACYQAVSGGRALVAARYQERALLGAGVGYLRAAGHRPSEYDRRLGPAPPPCGFVYLADVAALGGRCAGSIEQRSTPCGRPVTLCRCPPIRAPSGGPAHR